MKIMFLQKVQAFYKTNDSYKNINTSVINCIIRSLYYLCTINTQTHATTCTNIQVNMFVKASVFDILIPCLIFVFLAMYMNILYVYMILYYLQINFRKDSGGKLKLTAKSFKGELCVTSIISNAARLFRVKQEQTSDIVWNFSKTTN